MPASFQVSKFRSQFHILISSPQIQVLIFPFSSSSPFLWFTQFCILGCLLRWLFWGPEIQILIISFSSSSLFCNFHTRCGLFLLLPLLRSQNSGLEMLSTSTFSIFSVYFYWCPFSQLFFFSSFCQFNSTINIIFMACHLFVKLFSEYRIPKHFIHFSFFLWTNCIDGVSIFFFNFFNF